jgi:hypothetical protein
MSKLFHIAGRCFFNTRFNASYAFAPPVHVRNFNAYGGGFGTDGTIYPGNIFTSLIGLELSLSQNWVLALDMEYQHTNKNRFSGEVGTANLITPVIQQGPLLAAIGSPSSESFSMAPAIEYNWSESLGLIAGAWFTVAGRNASQFVSWTAAFNYYY